MCPYDLGSNIYLYTEKVSTRGSYLFGEGT